MGPGRLALMFFDAQGSRQGKQCDDSGGFFGVFLTIQPSGSDPGVAHLLWLTVDKGGGLGNPVYLK